MKKNVRIFLVLFGFVLILCALFALGIGVDVRRALNPQPVPPLTEGEKDLLQQKLDTLFPGRSTKGLVALPYTFTAPALDIAAKSAIIVDTKTGSILYEKNADVPIPPASLTKIVEMYVVFEAVEAGEVRLDSIVPLPPQCWSKNLPSDASRMYLDEGQRVTLRELLLGLAIASGNDASIAVAHFISGDMETFVQRMNDVVHKVGLEHTHFVESSGYSERNITTARDFALFARDYINRWPFALNDFHAQAELSYPKLENLPQNQAQTDRTALETRTITQKNTNKLLSLLDGCDGLKTGFIYESGYNIAVTAEQNGTRFLSVTLGGPGTNTAEGNQYRVHDNMNLFNWAFSHFADYTEKDNEMSFTVAVLGAHKKEIRLVPALPQTFTVPFITGTSPQDAAQRVNARVDIPSVLFGEIEQGKQYGTLSYAIDNTTLYQVPLVAEQSAGGFSPKSVAYAYSRLVYKALKTRHSFFSRGGM